MKIHMFFKYTDDGHLANERKRPKPQISRPCQTMKNIRVTVNTTLLVSCAPLHVTWVVSSKHCFKTFKKF